LGLDIVEIERDSISAKRKGEVCLLLVFVYDIFNSQLKDACSNLNAFECKQRVLLAVG
jgi:hypothetical protein